MVVVDEVDVVDEVVIVEEVEEGVVVVVVVDVVVVVVVVEVVVVVVVVVVVIRWVVVVVEGVKQYSTDEQTKFVDLAEPELSLYWNASTPLVVTTQCSIE